jgi:hypothetical protein
MLARKRRLGYAVREVPMSMVANMWHTIVQAPLCLDTLRNNLLMIPQVLSLREVDHW